MSDQVGHDEAGDVAGHKMGGKRARGGRAARGGVAELYMERRRGRTGAKASGGARECARGARGRANMLVESKVQKNFAKKFGSLIFSRTFAVYY